MSADWHKRGIVGWNATWSVFFFGVSGVALVRLVLNFSTHSEEQNWVLLATGAACALLARIDLLASIELDFGTAKLKAALQRKIDEAAATVKQLRLIAKDQTSLVVSFIRAEKSHVGRLGYDKTERLVSQLYDSLREIGLPDQSISELRRSAEQPWVLSGYYEAIRHLTIQSIGRERWDAAQHALSLKPLEDGQFLVPTPESLETVLGNVELNGYDTTEVLADYKHYFENAEHRRKSNLLAAFNGSRHSSND